MKSSYRKLCALTAVICGAWFVLFMAGCDDAPRPDPYVRPLETTPGFRTQRIAHDGFLMAYVVTDLSSGRRYLLNDEGGIVELDTTPVER